MKHRYFEDPLSRLSLSLPAGMTLVGMKNSGVRWCLEHECSHWEMDTEPDGEYVKVALIELPDLIEDNWSSGEVHCEECGIKGKLEGGRWMDTTDAGDAPLSAASGETGTAHLHRSDLRSVMDFNDLAGDIFRCLNTWGSALLVRSPDQTIKVFDPTKAIVVVDDLPNVEELEEIRCPDCYGRGAEHASICSVGGFYDPCHVCGLGGSCPTCGGTGIVGEPRMNWWTLKVMTETLHSLVKRRLPASVDSGIQQQESPTP